MYLMSSLRREQLTDATLANKIFPTGIPHKKKLSLILKSFQTILVKVPIKNHKTHHIQRILIFAASKEYSSLLCLKSISIVIILTQRLQILYKYNIRMIFYFTGWECANQAEPVAAGLQQLWAGCIRFFYYYWSISNIYHVLITVVLVLGVKSPLSFSSKCSLVEINKRDALNGTCSGRQSPVS